MPQFALVALFILLFTSNFAQVYHYETGKAIPVSKPGQIVWKSGTYLNRSADFGTLLVLENPSNPKSRLLNIPIVRILCNNSDSAKEPIFILNGGPGESNIQTHLVFIDLLDNHDIILMGYRGVDGSESLPSDTYKDALFSDTLSLTNYKNSFNKAFAQNLEAMQKQKIDILGYSLENVVNDIETICQHEKFTKISFVAYSYGTMLSQLYLNRYPEKVEQMALIGARPLGDFTINDSLFQQEAFLIFKNYKQKNQEGDSSYLDFQKVWQLSSDVKFMSNNDINPVRFSLFLFSQFYSIKKANELFIALSNEENMGYPSIVKKYNEFYQSYPTISMSDLFLKKQNWFNVSKSESDRCNSSESIISVVNHWYAPNNHSFSTNNNQEILTPNAIPGLFICAQFDIAAPIDLIQHLKQNLYLNSQIQFIEQCGHLDLFYEQKSKLDSLIYNYFSSASSEF